MDKRLSKLLAKSIYMGTSSWKYSGWKQQIYQRSYSSDKHFNEECLTEYAEHYATVGVDHTFYAWPKEPLFRQYMEQTPTHFKFSLKATEKTTIYQYPHQRRYGKESGKMNEAFLDVELFRDLFLAPLQPYKERLGPIMLEFGHFYPGTIASGSDFVQKLDVFFRKLHQKEQGFQFGVEIRNGNWLQKPYFDMLMNHQVAHVFNSWTKMPGLGEQLEKAKTYRPPCYLSRILLKPGISYSQAVASYEPYGKVQDKQPQLRKDAAKLILNAIDADVPAYVLVNNRCEGCAPETIFGILEYI